MSPLFLSTKIAVGLGVSEMCINLIRKGLLLMYLKLKASKGAQNVISYVITSVDRGGWKTPAKTRIAVIR